jgi:Cytochrome c oxidase subunit IIa family
MADTKAEQYNENGKIITGPSTVVVHEEIEEKFKPKGAIAFFVVLILICAVIWFGIYYIALSRQ